MEVLCTCDKKYLPHTGTMLCSLLEHNSVSRIHLFYSSIETRELAKFTSLVAKYGSEIVFYEIIPDDFKDLQVDKWYSIAIYYRLLAPRLLPPDIDKVLYLDSDVIVTRSLADLWNTDISGHALAAVPNNEDDPRQALGLPDGTKYFNSGVLLINLRFWRQHNVVEQAFSFIRNNPERVQYPDQDALNATLVHQWVELPTIWNWQCWWDADEGARNPAIVHFYGHHKPWHWSSEHPFRYEYRKYRSKTPWPYKEEGLPPFKWRLGYSLRMIARDLRGFFRAILPNGFRRWLKSQIFGTKF